MNGKSPTISAVLPFVLRLSKDERRVFQQNLRIDLIPFGPALIEQDHLSWPDGGAIMNVCGLEEALGCARDEEIAADLTLPVVTIPGLVLMKAIAYMDRPEERAAISSTFSIASSITRQHQVKADGSTMQEPKCRNPSE